MSLAIEPGARWPNVDEHLDGPEDVFVLTGQLGDGSQVFDAGTFIHNPRDMSCMNRTTLDPKIDPRASARPSPIA
ncbi:hypothetical protein ACMHYB_21500 [Sorangium sp. So ce1128]